MQALISVFYVPCASDEEAKHIAQTLIEEKLIACANIFPGVSSIYLWEGQIQHAAETILILKSVPEKKSALTQRVSALHSYSCPCVLELESSSINRPYAEWIRSLVAPPSLKIEAKPALAAKASEPSPNLDDDLPPWD